MVNKHAMLTLDRRCIEKTILQCRITISLIATQTTEITHVFHTKNTTSDGEPKPTSDKLSKKGGVESGEKQPQRRGNY